MSLLHTNSAESSLPKNLRMVLRRQKYHLVGSHSAVKRCKWLYESLVHDRSCYKQRFYGVKSHRCIQMTPTVAFCTMRCRFCWRVQPEDVEMEWNELRASKWDAPVSIVEACVATQRELVSGYKGNPKVPREKYQEAMSPKHVAISLSGEPTLYPDLGELIHEFHRKNFTTFLVTNGTMPKVLSRLSEEPTQLYVSVCAPNKDIFLKVCRPQIPNAWDRLNESLELLPSLSCRKVLRMTLVSKLNMEDIAEYSQLAQKASPDFIEPKAYVYVGFSRKRLTFSNMPQHSEVRDFALGLADALSYNLIDESKDSRVVLLSRFEKKQPL